MEFTFSLQLFFWYQRSNGLYICTLHYNLRKYAERDIINPMETRERLIQLKEETNLSWKAFSIYFGIPYRTVQDWYMGNRKMPEYLLRLMIYKVETEKMLKHKQCELSE